MPDDTVTRNTWQWIQRVHWRAASESIASFVDTADSLRESMEPMAAPGVSMFRSGSHCSWPCPLTCAMKYLPTCTNDCLESRRWCLKYASEELRQAQDKKPGSSRCLNQRPSATPGIVPARAEATSRVLLGKHIPVISSAGAFVFQRGLSHIVEPRTHQAEENRVVPDGDREARHTDRHPMSLCVIIEI